MEWTSEQQAILDYWSGGLSVLAGAGSGKTTTLVQKCLKLLKRNPQAKFIAVSFTEKSATDLKLKFSELMFKESGSGMHFHWMMTIHGLCARILQDFSFELGQTGFEKILSELESEKRWKQCIDSLWLSSTASPKTLDALSFWKESPEKLEKILTRMKELRSFGLAKVLGQDSSPFQNAIETLFLTVFEKYQAIKSREGSLDFQDLEEGAQKIVQMPHVRNWFQQEFDWILVDEFQDTNLIQASIIEQIARPQLSNVCIVGDPKQSIYRFRDADVRIFENFCNKLSARFSLTWNFRSRPEIIQVVNAVCAPSFEVSELTFEPLVAQRLSQQDEQQQEDSKEKECLHPAVLKLWCEQPSDLAQWLIQKNQAGHFSFGSVALIMRRIRGNEKWIQALVKAQIPITLSSGGLFWEDPRVAELVAFLKWWMEPWNTLSACIFLRSPWVLLSDELFNQWIQLHESKVCLLKDSFLNSSHGLAQLLRKQKSLGMRRPGELLWGLFEHSKISEELGMLLLTLWQKAEQCSYRGMSSREIIQDFSQAIAQKRREPGLPMPPLGEQGNLRVFTVHGSKGLEFPWVVLVDFEESERYFEAPVFFWDREKGFHLPTASSEEDGFQTNAQPQDLSEEQKTAQWKEFERKKNLAETKRLFYVSLTRAKDHLVFVCLGKKSELTPSPNYLKDDWRSWIHPKSLSFSIQEEKVSFEHASSIQLTEHCKFKEQDHPSQKKVFTFCSQGQKKLRNRHSVSEWMILDRCERAYAWTYLEDYAFFRNQMKKKESPWEQQGEQKKKDAQGLGRVIHELLETGSLQQEQQQQDFPIEHVVDWIKTSEWMQRNPSHQVLTEIAFEIALQEVVLVGAMDRVLLIHPNQAILLDFKTSQKRKSKKKLLSLYQTQLHLYAHALFSLDPKLQQVFPYLIEFSQDGVQTVALNVLNDPKALQVLCDRFLEKSQRLVRGAFPHAQKGPHCKICPHELACSAELADQEKAL